MTERSWSVPNPMQALGFWGRSRVHQLLRGWKNLRTPALRRWRACDGLADALADAPIVAQYRAPLWTDGRDDEFILVAGKVENLRIAARAFDGIVVPAGQCLSFWKQVGRPSRRRGYVPGREVRAGCVIPTVAGGICQISNALATCARQAGFELVERHAHSARVEQAPALDGSIDATVFWNYVDLRIRAHTDWRLDVTLTRQEIVCTVRAKTATPPRRTARPSMPIRLDTAQAPPVVRGCLTCEEQTCFRHRPQWRGEHARHTRHAWLLDGWTPEFDQWLRTQDSGSDRFLPIAPGRLLRSGRVARRWLELPTAGDNRTLRFPIASLRRAGWQRLHARHPGMRQASLIAGQRWLAQAYARRLQPRHTHLVIDQGLLPHLWQLGVLGGRSYDVLASALPMDEIQQRLDHARQDGNTDATLVDFRVPPELLAAENAAMRRANRVITAHRAVARHWAAQGLLVESLPWVQPACPKPRAPSAHAQPPLLVFPASALARKGFDVLIEALSGTDARLRILGTPPEHASQSARALEYGRYGDDWTARADAVVLPAHVEHNPRALLMALAAGIPVICTPACGLDGEDRVHLVPAGDVAALRRAIQEVLRTRAAPAGG